VATDAQGTFLKSGGFHDYEEEHLIGIRSLIKKYSDLGIRLILDLKRGIHVKSPPDAFTPILRQELKHYKQDIIHFLKSPQNLVASVASLGTESTGNPTVATLATDEKGTFKNRRLFWCWLLCKAKIIY